MDEQKNMNQQDDSSSKQPPQDAGQSSSQDNINGSLSELDALDSMQAENAVDPLESAMAPEPLSDAAPSEELTELPATETGAVDSMEEVSGDSNIQGEVTLDANALSEELPEEPFVADASINASGESDELPPLDSTGNVEMTPEPLTGESSDFVSPETVGDESTQTDQKEELAELPPLEAEPQPLDSESISGDVEPQQLEELPAETDSRGAGDGAVPPVMDVADGDGGKKEGRGRIIALVLIVILLLVALIGVYWWFFLRDGVGTTSPTPTPTPTVAMDATPTPAGDITSGESHLECRFGLCVEVPGPGANVCSSSFDCEADSTLTPTVTPETPEPTTVEPTVTPEGDTSPTPTTTNIGTPDPTNTPTPTRVPTPTYTPTPTATPLLTELPESGTTSTTLLILLSLIVAGGLGFFLMRKSQGM